MTRLGHLLSLSGFAMTVSVLVSTPVLGSGFYGKGGVPLCNLGNPDIVGTFTSTVARYSQTGSCTHVGSLGLARGTYNYKVTGAYSNNIAEETVEVLPPAIHEPSHSYGTWFARYSCPADPWLTNDSSLNCSITATKDQSPTDLGRPLRQGERTLSQELVVWRLRKPISANLLPEERAALAAKRDKDLWAETEAKRRARQKLVGGLQLNEAFVKSLAPVVLTPSRGQSFYNQTVVPIKLGPPTVTDTSQVNISDPAVKYTSSLTVSGYSVRIERKDASGRWVAQTTIPIGPAQAHSPSGYVGFGNGAPPNGITTPGAWRLSAQVSAPQQSGWSEWVDFHVLRPPTPTNALKPGVGFGK